ncbi:MAG: UDP-N-acetylglucosamine--N-acetylmuramyl-(pentapeptide) pyrophosphoryl-undecaprenol N-acetylglucosamine transferase [Actinomycetota bacterium]|nr:UDP-N-acetylglucosamine--N-acetylmuramyl-(pentapeptide) pyrophosphoryl-undecaprenol N-acetylglucosamine transferase [Actinomycetota bacterium]MCL6092476.1 UDP-N-acetylglucosamine--N-acetylmuramyl-(pentapeptide) pyrophosphoryl-undecaprenol N-acetylglucosamine transferase [Actinomycetota bacterium]MDA8167999.1 UDP-N-acetylglucosamine--N-acetylmuramyl-(pentapeptide) pyrophosphoryl-undecaprenol N-acetylglucosamine transferase [Actinomycetota bacterium]
MVIAAGGTAGHLVPALALAGALTRKGAAVSFIGTGRGLETKLVPEAGYELDLADLRGLERRLSPRTLLFFWSLLAGSLDCLRILRRRRPDVVVGGGGYVSAVPVFLAALRRRPALTVELDSYMGLANRFLAPLVDRVCLSFPIAGRQGGKYVVTGRPLPAALLEATAAEGRRLLALREGRPVVLVSGGSLGARSINLACARAFGRGKLENLQLVHVSGKRDHEMIRAILQEQGADPENYHLLDYTNSLPQLMAAADLVVGRAGASVMEVAALGKPALLVPYPHATADHQLHNAQWMADAGAAEIIPDWQLTAEVLKDRITSLLCAPERLREMAAASAALGRRDGAGRIAREIFTLAGRD